MNQDTNHTKYWYIGAVNFTIDELNPSTFFQHLAAVVNKYNNTYHSTTKSKASGCRGKFIHYFWYKK